MALSRGVFALLANVALTSCLADIPDLVVGGAAAGGNGTGGAAAAGGSSAGFCASLVGSPLLCEDFDDSEALPGAPWELSLLQDPREHVELDTEHLSAPRSLRAWVDEPMGGGPVDDCLYAKLTYHFEEDHPVLGIGLDVRSTAPGVAVVLQWSAAEPATSCFILLYNNAEHIEVSSQAIPPATTYPSLIVPDVVPALPDWRHIELTVDRSGATPTVTLGSEEPFELDPGWWDLCDGPASDLRLDLGAHCAGDTGATTDTNYDNVVVTAP